MLNPDDYHLHEYIFCRFSYSLVRHNLLDACYFLWEQFVLKILMKAWVKKQWALLEHLDFLSLVVFRQIVEAMQDRVLVFYIRNID